LLNFKPLGHKSNLPTNSETAVGRGGSRAKSAMPKCKKREFSRVQQAYACDISERRSEDHNMIV